MKKGAIIGGIIKPQTKSEECKLHPPFHQSDDLKCNHCCECKCHLEGRRSPCEKSCCQKQDQPQESQKPNTSYATTIDCTVHECKNCLRVWSEPKQDQPAEWEEEFDDYWFISEKRTRGSINAHRYEVKAFIKVLLSSQKQNLIRDIKNWSKGKNVTKDGLRHYLNTLKGESR